MQPEDDPKPPGNKTAPASPGWLLWLIPMAALVGLVWFVLRGDRSDDALDRSQGAGIEAAEPTVE